MQKSFEGLCFLVEKTFPMQLFTGAFFIFLNRQKNRMKILYWDQDGLSIWYKFLERGRFSDKNYPTFLNRKEFVMLLEGITPKRIQNRYKR